MWKQYNYRKFLRKFTSISVCILLMILYNRCQNRNEKFDELELISYEWTFSNSGKVKLEESTIRLNFYVNFNHKGECNVIINDDNNSFKKMIVPDSIIKDVISRFENIAGDTNMCVLDKNKTTIYDGPELKIRFTKNGIKKTVSFINSEYNNDAFVFRKFYKTIHSLIKEQDNNTNVISDTTKIKNKLNDFLEYIKIYDRNNYLTPPPIINDLN